MRYLIGLDLGTTAVKAVALAPDGELLTQASTDYPLLTDAPGRAVQQADDIWRGVRAVLHRLGAAVDPRAATGLCFSGAMHSLMPVTSTGEALAPALTWADNRAAPQAAALRRAADERSLYTRTGCPLQATYHPARLRWWQEQGIPPGTLLWVGLKDWILHRLTGVWAADTGLASTTGLLDIHNGRWDTEALALAGITTDALPPLLPPQAIAGRITSAAARATGLPAGMPVVAGNHDGGLANVGAGAAAAGEMAITVGTSGAIRLLAATPCLDPEMRTWCYRLQEGVWLAGGAINNGGLVLQWIRDACFQDLSGNWQARTEALLAEVAAIPPGAGGVIALPYLAGERTPHWDADGPATIHGLKLAHTRAHVARALLEGVAYCLADVWQALQSGLAGATGQRGAVYLTGGITHSPLWCQIVSDVLDLPLRPVRRADASALGAALLGQVALGVRDDLRPPEAWAADAAPIINPDPARHRLYADRHALFRTLYRRLNRE